MPIRKQVVTDGITSELRTIITAPPNEAALRAFVQAHNREEDRRSTFDGRAADLERVCRRHVDAWRTVQVPGEPIAVDFKSREWYAQEILTVIEEVRNALARGAWQRAASDAVVVGALAAEAEAKHNWTIVQLGIKRTRDTQTSGRGRGKQITAAARAEDSKTRQLVRQYRTSDELEGHLVGFLASHLKRNPQTIRRRLKRLGISSA